MAQNDTIHILYGRVLQWVIPDLSVRIRASNIDHMASDTEILASNEQ